MERLTCMSMRAFLIVGVIIALLWSPVALAEDKLPRTILLGVQQVGTLQHSMATGLSKVASEGTGVPVIVRPHSGSTTHIPLLNKGELDFSVAPTVDAGMSFQGPDRLKVAGVNPYPHAPNIRIVMVGSPLYAGLIVQKKSPIRSARDLKGRRVAGKFPTGLGAYINMYVHLIGADLTWEDTTVVPFSGLSDSMNALIQGRVDVTVIGVGAPTVRDADARVGVRFVSDDCSPEGTARILEAAPGYRTVNLKKGMLPGVVEDICVTAWPVLLLASDKTADNVVTAVLKALWENTDKLNKLHPGLRLWKRETAVDNGPTAPYHRAAVAFYKSVGAWNAEVEAANKKLLLMAR
jgi:hypothetical protein